MANEYEARTKVGSETNALIEAHARRRKIDRATVIREVLDTWASEQRAIQKLTESILRAEGQTGS